MIEFTKEEISLCEQVAEKHRKEIKKGDWAIEPDRANIPLLVIDTQMEYITLSLNYEATHDTTCKSLIPLWTISDCLEFFEEREYTFERSYQLGGIFNVRFISGEGTKRGAGDTFLIACLKAVLAVLGENVTSVTKMLNKEGK